MVTLAGLLKFYPLTLFVMFLRERIAYFVMLAVGAAVLVGGFGWHFQAELREMTKNIPTFPNFTVTFGYRQIPYGLGIALKWLLEDAGMRNSSVLAALGSAWFILEVLCMAVISALLAAHTLAKSVNFRSSLAALTASERAFLIIGAAVICGCFFAGQSISYRGIYFLFVMPGVLVLSATPVARRVRILFCGTAGAIIYLLWGLAIQQVVASVSGGSADPLGKSAAMYFFWMSRELTWWGIVTVLIAVLFCFITESPVWNAITGLREK